MWPAHIGHSVLCSPFRWCFWWIYSLTADIITVKCYQITSSSAECDVGWNCCWSRLEQIVLYQHRLIGSEPLYLRRDDIFQVIFAHLFYVLRSSGGTGMAALKDHLSPLCSLSRWQVLNLGQVSITYSHTWHSHFLSPINQLMGDAEAQQKTSFRLWVISMMDPWASWHSPVMCFSGKTYCEHIMQRTSHPWLLSYTFLGFSVMYSLASTRVFDDASIALQVLGLAVGFIVSSSPASIN